MEAERMINDVHCVDTHSANASIVRVVRGQCADENMDHCFYLYLAIQL